MTGCHAQGAIPVGSYRHTHYDKERFGLMLMLCGTPKLVILIIPYVLVFGRL